MRSRGGIRWTAAALAVATVGVVALGACGNDSNDKASSTSTTKAAATGTAAACQEWIKVDAAANTGPGGGGQQPTAEEGKAFAAKLQPLVASFESNAPADVKDTATQIKAALDAAATSGDLSHLTPQDPTFGAELAKVETWVHDSCGFQKVDVMAVDYDYQGMPKTLQSGPTSFLMMNHAKDEAHEINVIRLNDDAKVTADQLVAAIEKNADQAEQQYQDQITVLANTGAGPGQSSAVAVSLTKGSYVVACFVPVGGKDGAPPHAQQGMIQSFTVS